MEGARRVPAGARGPAPMGGCAVVDASGALLGAFTDANLRPALAEKGLSAVVSDPASSRRNPRAHTTELRESSLSHKPEAIA